MRKCLRGWGCRARGKGPEDAAALDGSVSVAGVDEGAELGSQGVERSNPLLDGFNLGGSAVTNGSAIRDLLFAQGKQLGDLAEGEPELLGSLK
jgi:hypothetical protein